MPKKSTPAPIFPASEEKPQLINTSILADDYPDSVNFSENALTVIKKRYVIKDENRQPLETPKDMLHRVARVMAEVDAKYGATPEKVQASEAEFFRMMADLEFLPNSPTFTGAGTKLGQLSACFVLPVEDDMGEILRTMMNMGLIHKSGGGTGFNFSRLRPKNDVVGSTGGVSSGPLGFLQMFNDVTEQIKQGGTRRGANMGILRVDHPDIEEFIRYKAEEGKLTNFNISVGITKEFMKALKTGTNYALINPRNKKVVKKISAQQIFDVIVDHAWKNGEPGLIFLDHINEANRTPHLGEIESTNPCGEQPLLPYESCNLGAINLAKMIKKNSRGEVAVDYDRLRELIKKVVHFLDNVIDANKYPITEIGEMTFQTRKIGITVMGFADMLYQLGISYNSEEGLEMAEKVMGIVEEESHKYSAELAKTRGEFPAFKGSKWDTQGLGKVRNAATTSCNPTGTLSIIASCSSGIEPVFALAYIKTVMDNDDLPEINPYFLNVAKERGFYSEELVKKIIEKGSIQDLDEVPEDVKRVFVVASDISPEWHVRMQAAFQRHTDAGISKTINFPNSASREEVAESYLLAYDLNCKGITIYRDGSRQVQVLNKGSKEKESEEKAEVETIKDSKIAPRPRPEVLSGTTEKIRTGLGNLYVTVNEDQDGPFEVFAGIGKSGGDATSLAEAIGRLISLCLRSGVEIKSIIEQLKGIRGSSPVWQNGELILSAPDAIGKALERYVERKNTLQLQFASESLAVVKPTEAESKANDQIDFNFSPTETLEETHQPAVEIKKADHSSTGGMMADICPECGSTVQHESGCILCHSCGWSKCS